MHYALMCLPWMCTSTKIAFHEFSLFILSRNAVYSVRLLLGYSTIIKYIVRTNHVNNIFSYF